MRLDGSAVVVTGAARGIGAAIARRLHAEGARLVLADLDARELDALAAELGARAVPGDAASDAGVAALVDAAREHLGRIDLFFANAGIAAMTDLADTTDAEWAQVFEVNVMAHVRAARHLLPAWVEQGGGRFVVTASAAGLLTMLGDPSYSASKHAAIGFAAWLAATYRHRSVVVQAICPQGVTTRMLEGAGELAGVLNRDEALTPDQVADCVVEGLSGEAFYILPHPEVAEYTALRGSDPDRWLAGMNKLQQKVEHPAWSR